MLLPPGKINMVSVFLGIFQILGKVNYFVPDIVTVEDGSGGTGARIGGDLL